MNGVYAFVVTTFWAWLCRKSDFAVAFRGPLTVSGAVLRNAEGALQDLGLVGEVRGQLRERIVRPDVRARAGNAIAPRGDVAEISGDTELRLQVSP